MLFGRTAELRELNNALHDPNFSMVVVRGQSGAGKTALIETALEALSRHGAIIGSGKYEEGSAGGAFVPILKALGRAVDRALDLLYDPEAGSASLRTILGGQAPLLVEAGLSVPGLVRGVGSNSEFTAGATVQIVDAMARIFAWLDGFGVDIVLFVDDWQRAPAEARTFLSLTSERHSSNRCRVVLAERTTAPAAMIPGAATIEIGPLRGAERVALLDHMLGEGAGEVVADWLGSEEEGLPFDLIEIARALQEHGAISNENNGWRIDASRAAAIGRSDFHQILVNRVLALPVQVQEVGAALALWGDEIALPLVAQALDAPLDETLAAADALKRAGIIGIAEGAVRFSHDQLRAALLEVLPASRCKEIAAGMAERIAHAVMPSQLGRQVLQLRLFGGLEEADPKIWRNRFAKGSVSARITADDNIASVFAEAALALEQREACADLEMSFTIMREALFAAAMRREPSAVEARALSLIGRCAPARRPEAYEAAIVAARRAGDLEQAWRWCTEALRHFKVRLPRVARLHHIVLDGLRWRLSLALKPLRTERQEQAMDGLSRLSNIAGLIAFERQSLLALLIMLRAGAQANSLGLSDTVWAANNAVLAANFRDYRLASFLGALALSRPSNFMKAATLYRALYFGQIWTRPFAELRDRCMEIYSLGVAEGDLAMAALAIRNDALLGWRTSPDLASLAETLADHESRAQRLGDAQLLGAIRHFRMFTNALRGNCDALSDRGMYGDDAETAAWAAKNMAIVWMEVLAIRGDWHTVVAIGEEQKKIRPTLNIHTGAIIWRFYESLARLRIGLPMRSGDIRYLRKTAKLNLRDHRCKVSLLEAELARTRGERNAALRGYTLAVRQAFSVACRFEAGIIAECAAYGAASLGDETAALRYRSNAQSIWRSWGATAKLDPEDDLTLPHDVASQLTEAQSQTAAAVRSERAKSRFLAEVSHELRTPLQAMQSLLDLAASGQRANIEELREAFGSFRSIVDDLTDLGAMAGDAPLRVSCIDLGQLIDSEASLFGAAARERGLAFSTSIETEGDAFVKADGHRIRQVLRNLLSNAIKYTGHGGVDLALAVHNLNQHTAAISITIEDTGPGLKEADLARLFEPFDRGGREDAAGLGLGLPLARRIAERMDGNLIGENRAEGGARFVFSFTAERSERPQEIAGSFSGKILLVEDIALNRRLLAAGLRDAGHSVIEAGNGAEALAALNAGAFDLIILDLGLPDMDGLEVLARMPAQVPAILVTASTAAAIQERAFAAGVEIVLHKPVSNTELQGAVAKALSGTTSVVPLSPQTSRQLLRLTGEARREMQVAADALIALAGNGNRADLARSAHRLSGLAAQFGESRIADAASALEACCLEGTPLQDALALLGDAVSSLGERQGEYS